MDVWPTQNQFHLKCCLVCLMQTIWTIWMERNSQLCWHWALESNIFLLFYTFIWSFEFEIVIFRRIFCKWGFPSFQKNFLIIYYKNKRSKSWHHDDLKSEPNTWMNINKLINNWASTFTTEQKVTYIIPTHTHKGKKECKIHVTRNYQMKFCHSKSKYKTFSMD